MDPNSRWFGDGENNPLVSCRAGSKAKRLSFSSHASSYSKVTASSRLRTWRRKRPTRSVGPFKSTCTSMSSTATSQQGGPQPSTCREISRSERLTNLVATNVGGSAQAFEQPK